MQAERTLRVYLDGLRQCEDAKRMTLYFGVGDNFSIHFYGDTERVLPVVRDAFLNSPSEDGLKTKWDIVRTAKKGDLFLGDPRGHDLWHFSAEGDRVVAFLRYFMDGDLKDEYQRDRLEELELTGVSLSLHPNTDANTMKSALLDIGEFIMMCNLAVRFRGYNNNANAYHIPVRRNG